MIVKVTHIDNSVSYPSFDPAVLEGVASYYNEQFRIGFIKDWQVL